MRASAGRRDDAEAAVAVDPRRTPSRAVPHRRRRAARPHRRRRRGRRPVPAHRRDAGGDPRGRRGGGAEPRRSSRSAPARIAMVAMGRYGGFELSYGSDADVLFVLDADEGVDQHEAASYAQAVAEELRRLLALPGGDPPLEVDADLRPEGKQGPLVRSLDSYAAYYAKWSKVWEAQALLRADAVVGDPDLRRRFVELIDPLRYPEAGLSAEDVEEVRRIKARVDKERLPRGADPKTHLKLGRGGLADIEWTVQLLQMRHGAEVAGLRTSPHPGGARRRPGGGADRRGRRGRADRGLADGEPGPQRGDPGARQGWRPAARRQPGAGRAWRASSATRPGATDEMVNDLMRTMRVSHARGRAGVLGMTVAPLRSRRRPGRHQAARPPARGARRPGRRLGRRPPPGLGGAPARCRQDPARPGERPRPDRRRRGRQGRRPRPEHRDPGPVGRPGRRPRPRRRHRPLAGQRRHRADLPGAGRVRPRLGGRRRRRRGRGG